MSVCAGFWTALTSGEARMRRPVVLEDPMSLACDVHQPDMFLWSAVTVSAWLNVT